MPPRLRVRLEGLFPSGLSPELVGGSGPVLAGPEPFAGRHLWFVLCEEGSFSFDGPIASYTLAFRAQVVLDPELALEQCDFQGYGWVGAPGFAEPVYADWPSKRR